MNTTGCFSRRIYHVSTAIFLLVVISISVGASPVQAEGGISVSWQANTIEDEVVGYRLYYGDKSRFAAGAYDYYIDFTSWQRCPADKDGFDCEPLPSDAVTCVDLYQETPQCTVHDLQDSLYFAMTAYNAQDESDYTQELNSISPVAPEVVIGLQAVYGLLLN